MTPDVVGIATFLLVGLLVVGYVLFIRWRIQVHRSRQEADLDLGGLTATRSAEAMLRGDALPPTIPPAPPVAPLPQTERPDAPTAATDADPPVGPAPTSEPPVRPDPAALAPPPSPDAPPKTLLEAVAGIALPCDLVPHPDATPRPKADDRVALITRSAGFDELKSGMTTALEALGYQLTWAEEQARAVRGATEVWVAVYDRPSVVTFDGVAAFPIAPEGSSVVDLWLARLA